MDIQDLIMPLVVGGIFWLLGLWLVFTQWRRHLRLKQLKEAGRTTTGTITQVMDNPSRHGGSVLVFYTYTIDGQAYNGKYDYPRGYSAIKKDAEIPVAYLPDNPKISMLETNFDYKKQLLMVSIGGIVVIVIGIAAFINLAGL